MKNPETLGTSDRSDKTVRSAYRDLHESLRQDLSLPDRLDLGIIGTRECLTGKPDPILDKPTEIQEKITPTGSLSWGCE